LLANAFRHPPYLYLTRRVRQQAGSYRAAPGQLIVSTLRVATQVQAHRASQTIRAQTGETTRSVAGCIPTPSVGTTKDAQAAGRGPYGIPD
jgi:hypothetical protein